MDQPPTGTPSATPPPASAPPAASAGSGRLLGGVIVALLIGAAVVVLGARREHDAPPAPAAATAAAAPEVDGRPFRLEPYLEKLVITARASGARFDQLTASYRAGSLSAASYTSSVSREVVQPYSEARRALHDLPPYLPEPMKEHIQRVLDYVDMRGELWITASQRAVQPALGNRPVLTDDDVARLASLRAASELDQVAVPPAR